MRPLAYAFLLAAMLLTLPGAATADEDDDDGSMVSEARCPLAKARRAGKIVTSTEKETCGSGGCMQSQSIEIVDAKGKTLLSWSTDIAGDFGGGLDFAAACEGGAVVISDSRGELMKLTYDPGAQQLKLPPSIRKQVEADWRAPPARGDAIADRERLADTLDILGRTIGGNDPSFEIAGLDGELLQSQWLLVARDKMEAGAWESAEKILADAVPTAAVLSALVVRRRAGVATRLTALRRKSVPVAVKARHRVGTMPGYPELPVVAEKMPTLFWRGDSLCVAQEDRKPPTEMRCLDPATRKWGAREPLQPPRSTGERLRWESYPNVTRCEGRYVVQKRVPESGADACRGGPGEDAESLVGVVDGDAMLLATESGLFVNRGPEKDEKLAPRKTAELLRSSGGSWLVGDSCCRFLPDGRVERIGKDAAERRWPLLGAPPEGQRWVQTPLASPSQTWAVAFSEATQGNTNGVTLWLLRLAAHR